jgi:hypothetical protein
MSWSRVSLFIRGYLSWNSLDYEVFWHYFLVSAPDVAGCVFDAVYLGYLAAYLLVVF